YWWLAYDFLNYLLSCSTCNRIHKRERFPLPPGAAALTYEARVDLGEEAALLLDPVSDPVESWVRIDLTSDLYRVEPIPGLPTRPERRAHETIRFFRLNENGMLVKQRIQFINRALKAIEPARAGDPEKQREIA